MFHERVTWKQVVVLIIIIIGVLLSTKGFGGFPFISIILAMSFAIYTAVKKELGFDSVTSSATETLLMLPFAIGYILVFCRNESGLYE